MSTESVADPQENNNKTDIIDLGAGDLKLCVREKTFKTHRYKLNKFSTLKDRIQEADYPDKPRYVPTIIIPPDECGVEDFSNTFKVLYASVIKGPFTFDPPVLISALRISSVYNYPQLRAFCIRHLEGIPLTAILRIELAREFQLTSWEGPAYDELYNRENAITQEEARVLGSDAFSVVARMREEEKMKKGEATLKEAIRQARREADEQANRVASEQARREEEAREAAFGQAEEAKNMAIARAVREANKQANRVALELAEAKRKGDESQAFLDWILETICLLVVCFAAKPVAVAVLVMSVAWRFYRFYGVVK